ncbi:MAG: hypothetical protein F4Y44_06520, partial [Chloroflexi bacterium]|nr:hypothetical protein [Chloroflexota bacterium]
MRFDIFGQEKVFFLRDKDRDGYILIYLSVLLCAAVVIAACSQSLQPTVFDTAPASDFSTPVSAAPTPEPTETPKSKGMATPTEIVVLDTDETPAGDAAHREISPIPVPTVTVEVAMPTAAAVVPGIFGPPTLDEYIFFSDVIAIVRPISQEASFLSAQNADGDTFYSPLIHSHFEVIEYLKGSGEAEIRVDIGRQPFDLSQESAVDFAETELKAQSLRLDSSESVAFLQIRRYPDEVVVPSNLYPDGEGARSISALGEGTFYAITAGNTAQGIVGVAPLSEYTTGLGFFPQVKDSGSLRSFQSIGAATEAEAFSTTSYASSIHTGHDISVELPIEFSIEDLRERIGAMEALIREGEGVEGWEECIESQLLHKNAQRPIQDILSSVFDFEPSPSGLPVGSIVHEFDVTIHRLWFTGDNARLFD